MIRLAKSTITNEDKTAVLNILDQEFLGMGSAVQDFEKKLEQFFNRTVVTVSNGTAALQLALQSSDIGIGDEVLVPSLTYVASFQAISATGATPVACDIDESLHMDPRDAKARINKNTKAIMPIHYGGSAIHLDEIYKLAEENELRVVEDAAHAFGSRYKNQRIGSFGDIACFSFDGIKNITAGEGGCIVTADKEVISRARDLRLLGVCNDSEKRFARQRSWEFDVTEQGWRFHMSDIMAALGLSQLQRFDEIAKKRQEIASRYDELLSGLPGFVSVIQDRQEVVPHLYTIILDKGVERDKLRNTLETEGIQTGVHYFPNHMLSFYKNSRSMPLPVTEAIYPRMLSLPLHLDLSNDEQSFIANTLAKLVN